MYNNYLFTLFVQNMSKIAVKKVSKFQNFFAQILKFLRKFQNVKLNVNFLCIDAEELHLQNQEWKYPRFSIF